VGKRGRIAKERISDLELRASRANQEKSESKSPSFLALFLSFKKNRLHAFRASKDRRRAGAYRASENRGECALERFVSRNEP